MGNVRVEAQSIYRRRLDAIMVMPDPNGNLPC